MQGSPNEGRDESAAHQYWKETAQGVRSYDCIMEQKLQKTYKAQ